MNPQLTGTAIGVALTVWIVYRRIRRNFGRQRLSERRLYIRTAILAILGALLLRGAIGDPRMLASLLGGCATGAMLGFFALRHTTFESTPEGRFYVPHTYFGLGVTALVLGRVLYRILQIYQGAAATSDPNPFGAIQRSPLTAAVFGLLIGYYVLFNLGVIRAARTLPGPATAPSATDPAPR